MTTTTTMTTTTERCTGCRHALASYWPLPFRLAIKVFDDDVAVKRRAEGTARVSRGPRRVTSRDPARRAIRSSRMSAASPSRIQAVSQAEERRIN